MCACSKDVSPLPDTDFSTPPYQLCFKEFRNIESSAEEEGGEHEAGHPPGDAGAEVALPVLVWSAHTAVPGAG